MARMIPVNSEEKVSRKLAVERNDEFGLVRLVNHSVRASKDSTEAMVFERITLQYPGCGSTPPWLLERAARADWIVVQRKLRELPTAERSAFDGKTLDVTALEKYFEMKKAREPFEARLRALAGGTLSRSDFEATLTKAERGQWEAMQGLITSGGE